MKFLVLPNGNDDNGDPDVTPKDGDDHDPVAILIPGHVGKNIPPGAKLTLGICKEKETVNNNLYNICHECKVKIDLGHWQVLFNAVQVL